MKTCLKVGSQWLTNLIEERALAMTQCLEDEYNLLSQKIDEIEREIQKQKKELKLQKLTA